MEKKLNKEQLKAITHKSGPLLIIAGAGTGKTTVITQRIKHLISTNAALPQEILALTFTQKAALEMEGRVDEIVDWGMNQVEISTFHGFCDKLLRDEGLNIGIDTNYKLLSVAESIKIIQDNLFEMDLDYFRPKGNPTKFIEAILKHFERLKDEDVSPDEYADWVKSKKFEDDLEKKKYEELANAYIYYENLKIENSLMDFGDLIVWTLKLFRERKNVLKQYQNKFKYILVDEFQDTNYSQSQIVYMLSRLHKNVTVVGDDDQSIYRFRGAAISNILQFRQVFPDTKVIVLTKNYRSNQEILDKAYNLIQFNNPDRLEFVEKIDKKLHSPKKGNKKSLQVIFKSTQEEEVQSVVEEILKLKNKKNYKFSDFAILARANSHALEFAKGLEAAGIPYFFPSHTRFFSDQHVSNMTSLIKVLVDPFDSINLYKILSFDCFEIPSLEVLKLVSISKKQDESLFEVAQKFGSDKVQLVLSTISKYIDKSKKQSSWEVLYQFLIELKILNRFLEEGTWEAQLKVKNTSKFLENLKIYENANPDTNIIRVSEWLDLVSQFGQSSEEWEDEDAVRVFTVHGAKGLEFPVVFLVNLVNLRFPSTNKSEQIPIPLELVKETLPMGDYHTEEERRLFYVGMTRAKDYLYLTAAQKYKDNKLPKKISPFVLEAMGEVVKKPITTNDSVEIEIKKGESKLKVEYLSHSQIETFKICPLHYKLRYMVGLHAPKSASESIGVSIHAALKDFYTKHKKKERLSEKIMLELLDKNWLSQGYGNKKYEKSSFERARNYLSGYYKNSYDKNTNTLYLEKKFVINIGSKQETFVVGGVMDRVDDLGNGKVEIIDYKTSENVPTQKEVDKNEQLTMYALLLNKNPEDIVLSLYYFENQIKISTTRTKAQIEKAKKDLFEIKKEIEQSDFNCSGHYFCQDCEYHDFCKFAH
jgi:DNA helicase-2/ATP-dependent DNA helicase PcrA